MPDKELQGELRSSQGEVGAGGRREKARKQGLFYLYPQEILK